MKRFASIVVLSAGLAATPAMADHENDKLLNRENVGGAIGATIGGLVGSGLGDGDSKAVTTAAGAVGGYVVGRNVAHNYSGHRGYAPDRNRHSSHRRHYRDNDRHDSRRLSPIDKTFRARTTSNVRSGPSTRFRIVDRLHHRERVHVIGKVRGRNWFMVRTDHRRGFVYAPLLRPAHHGYRSHRRWGDHDRHRDRPRGGWYR